MSHYIDFETTLINLEQRITDLTSVIERQNIEIARLGDMIVDLSRRSEWNDAQFGQLLRVLSSSVREIRTTQIDGLLNDGPVSTQALRELLQHVSGERLAGLTQSLESLEPPDA